MFENWLLTFYLNNNSLKYRAVLQEYRCKSLKVTLPHNTIFSLLENIKTYPPNYLNQNTAEKGSYKTTTIEKKTITIN